MIEIRKEEVKFFINPRSPYKYMRPLNNKILAPTNPRLGNTAKYIIDRINAKIRRFSGISDAFGTL